MRYLKHVVIIAVLVGCIYTYQSYQNMVNFSMGDAGAKIYNTLISKNTKLVHNDNSVTSHKPHRMLTSNKSGHSSTSFVNKLKTNSMAVPAKVLSRLYLEKHGVVDFINTSTENKKIYVPMVTTAKSSFTQDRHLFIRNYINVNFQGRLGNHMFQFASLYGISRHQQLIPVVNYNCPLWNTFNISVGTSNHLNNAKTYNEQRGCVFEKEAFNVDNKFNWTLNGYFQSWKYFTEYSREIRRKLSFRPHIHNEAEKQFKEIMEANSITFTTGTTFVAIHIRRGDMANSRAMIKYGYTSADVNYINRAMLSFRANFSNIVFLISSDDISWCRTNIKGKNLAFAIQKNPPEIDMAVLTHCNHSIITTGSYGWWTAWLIGGKTIYYKDYPKPKSELSKLFNSDDYRPPEWIPM